MSNVKLFFLIFFPITIETKDYYGAKGSNITLICPYKKEFPGRLQWSYINATESPWIYSIDALVNRESLPSELYTRLSVTGNYAIGEYNLQISNIRETDEGRYICINTETAQQGFQRLYLIIPPSNVSIENVTPTQRLLGTEGQDMMVSCVAVGGKPPPNVTLKVDGTSLATGIQSVKYTLMSISRSYDRTTVTCQSYNEANVNNPNSDTAQIYLNLRPLQPIFSPDPVRTEETKPLVVSCTSTGSRPHATFQWMIGLAIILSGITTTPVYNTADDTYLVTSSLTYTVDRTFNRETVACSAYNNVFTKGVVATTILDVKYAPNISVTNVTYIENLTNRTVKCILIGNPPTYTYYRWQHRSTYGVLIRELDGGQDGVLTLPNIPVEARYQDSGEYVCTAGNGITGTDGKKQQSGSGYVIVNARPVFTNDNNSSKYGEPGKDVDIQMYVYSVPKYTSLILYKSNKGIMLANKYTYTDLAAVVSDTFHGTKVQLNGYKITLTIKNLEEPDFNVTYTVELSNDVGQPVIFTVLLESASAPETPKNFIAVKPSESSIVVQWEAGYNGGNEQTFYVEYRIGSNIWMEKKIPDTKQTGRQTFILKGLVDGKSYELRMYAENKFNKSLPTKTETMETIKGSKVSQSEYDIAAVAGGLSAVILLLLIINVVLLILLRKGIEKKRKKAQSSRRKDKTAYHNPLDCKETGQQDETRDEKHKQNTTFTGFAEEYETLGMKDKPNTYSALLSQQDKTLNVSDQDYETLGAQDNPNTYSELRRQQGQKQSETPVDLYESVSEPSKSTAFTKSKTHQGQTYSEYTNVKI